MMIGNILYLFYTKLARDLSYILVFFWGGGILVIITKIENDSPALVASTSKSILKPGFSCVKPARINAHHAEYVILLLVMYISRSDKIRSTALLNNDNNKRIETHFTRN